jgi:hypothetical protein
MILSNIIINLENKILVLLYMHLKSFIKLILFLIILYFIILCFDGKEKFTNIECTTAQFTYLNNFIVTDNLQNSYSLIEYKDLLPENKLKLPLNDLIISNPTIYSYSTDMSSIEIINTGIIIYPVYLDNTSNISYTISTFLKTENNCRLYINYPEYKIGIYNDDIINNLLCYLNIEEISTNSSATFKPINIYNPYSIIPVIDNIHTLVPGTKNPITFNTK